MAIRESLELCGDFYIPSWVISYFSHHLRKASLCVIRERDGQGYKRRTGGPLCVYNDKEVSKVTLDRSSPRIINGKSLIMTPRYILIPDPIQFYNHLIRIVSLSLVDAFLCSYYLFCQRRCNFHKAFYLNWVTTSLDSPFFLIFFFGRDGLIVLLLHLIDPFSCSAKLP